MYTYEYIYSEHIHKHMQQLIQHKGGFGKSCLRGAHVSFMEQEVVDKGGKTCKAIS